MQTFIYCHREVPGVGTLEDFVRLHNGVTKVTRSCVPGSTHRLAEQAVFFGERAHCTRLEAPAFEILVKRLADQGTLH